MTTNEAAPFSRLVSIKLLDLDPQNPRVLLDPKPSQLDLLEYLYYNEGLDELVMSFVQNGYFVQEPMVVVPTGRRFTVVEGNRRLATLKILLDEDLRAKLNISDWPILTLAQRRRLTDIPVVVHAKRSDLMAFLGYRHITGAKRWAPFQKSRFVAQLVEDGFDLNEIQELIGDSTQAVKKLYQEWVVYRQVTEDLDVDPQPIRDRFSLMEVTLGQRPIKSFLGLPKSLPSSPTTELVPDERLDNLEKVVGWVFGAGDWPLVISESRDINRKLAKVIGSKDARTRLEESGDLDLAYELTDGEQQSLIRSLTSAERAIRSASGLVAVYASDEEVKKAVERLAQMIDGLSRQLD